MRMRVWLKVERRSVFVLVACVDFFFLFCYNKFFLGGVNKVLKGEKLSAGAGVHSHVGVDFEHHVLVLVEEEDAEGRHLLGDAARLGDAWDHAHRPHYALDGGVVRGLQSLQHRGRNELVRRMRG